MIPFGSFSLLSDKFVKNSLINMKTILKEGGKLLLTVMTNTGTVEDIPDWMETNRSSLDHNEIIEYKKVNYDQASRMLNINLNYQLVKDGQIVKSEIMDFPIRLYEPGEFKTILTTIGFGEVILHEVINGYGEGSSFQVFECVI